MWRDVWKMRIKATPVVKALERCLSNVFLNARHARAEINTHFSQYTRSGQVDFSTEGRN